MPEYLLGIDNGSTVTKAALFNLEGREVRAASRTLEVDCPHPGWAEGDMGVLWQSIVEVVREVITASGADPRHIMGIGNSGQQRATCCLAEEASKDVEGQSAELGEELTVVT